MKTNGAPEKLYLLPNGLISYCRNTDEDVEYTRTDAFIERAARWIENNLSKYSELTDEDEYGKKLKEPVMNVFYGQAVKDFKNYMKGE